MIRERRRGQRLAPTGDAPLSIIRLRTGGELRVLNIGSGGALVEGSPRLSPGRQLELRIGTRQGMTRIRATVARSAVSVVAATSVEYRSALTFDAPVDLGLAPPHAMAGGG